MSFRYDPECSTYCVDPRPSCKYSRLLFTIVDRESPQSEAVLLTHPQLDPDVMFTASQSRSTVFVMISCIPRRYRVHTRSSMRPALITIRFLESYKLFSFTFFLFVVISLKSFRMMVLLLDDPNTTCILTHFHKMEILISDYSRAPNYISIVRAELERHFTMKDSLIRKRA